MVWITGAAGLLGKELSRRLSELKIPQVGTGRDVPITEPSALRRFAERARPSWIINCAAFTEVDRAEDEEDLARRVNAEGARNVARCAAEIGARMLHLSTDYVFPGDLPRPLLESDPVGPLSAYGRTKEEGERLVLGAAPDSIILRTAWLYAGTDSDFVGTMIRLLGKEQELKVVADRHGSPTRARDLAEAISTLITAKAETPGGVYHFAGAGMASWYDVACAIRSLALQLGILDRAASVVPQAAAERPARALRPAWSALDSGKFARTFGSAPQAWREGLAAELRSRQFPLRQ